jgi:regulator of protease activity HflC (stomatin/prohibitin superfamily)
LDNNYFFIKNRTLYDRKKIHNYKLIINASSVVFNIDDDLQYSSGDLQGKLQHEINNFKDVLGSYIDNYGLGDKKQPTKFQEEKVEEKVEEEVEEEKEKVAQEKEKAEEEKVAQEKAEEEKVAQEKAEEEKEKSAIASAEQTTQTKKSKRCPNGTRKNKKTGLCEKI